jgi:hypothetical protein
LSTSDRELEHVEVVMAVGGRVASDAGAALEAWASTLKRPIRLGGTGVACEMFRHRTGVPHNILKEDVDVQLAPEDDRYRFALHRNRWRPLGNKSGPNLQWFQILEAVAVGQRAEWLLLLEADTRPVGNRALESIRRLISQHSEAWVIGAHPHPSAVKQLDPRLREHLNGVALYHVGDQQFIHFLREVWLPSLLSIVQDNPSMAFDCLSSPGLWADLPEDVAAAWRRERDRFVPTDTIVNASSLSARDVKPVVRAVLADDKAWLLHAKDNNESK